MIIIYLQRFIFVQRRLSKYTISEDDDCTVLTSDSTDKSSKTTSNTSIVAPRKRKKVITQSEALSQLSSSLSNLGDSQKERMEMWLMADQKREEAYLKYQERQSELNRQHELRMVQLIAGLQNRGNSQHSNFFPTMQTHLPTVMQSQHPTQVMQHPETHENTWSVMKDETYSSISYRPSGMGTSNDESVYTNLDHYNK